MNTEPRQPDLFPEALSSAYAELALLAPYEPYGPESVWESEQRPAELLEEALSIYEDDPEPDWEDSFNPREHEEERLERLREEYEGDDSYARDVCVKRWGPI